MTKPPYCDSIKSNIERRNEMIKNCVLCNKVFKSYHLPQQFCSYKCAAIFKAKQRPKRSILKKCLYCNKEFKVAFSEIKVGKGKFCSNTCSGFYRRTGINSFCKICNKPIVIRKNRVSQKEGNFCSYKCKGIAHSKYFRGEKCANWKGGRGKSRGYICILKPSHPSANGSGYVREHRLVMEKYLGRYLETFEFVHHRNKIKDDNRIENLQIVTKKTHFGNVRCPHCLKEFLIK